MVAKSCTTWDGRKMLKPYKSWDVDYVKNQQVIQISAQNPPFLPKNLETHRKPTGNP